MVWLTSGKIAQAADSFRRATALDEELVLQFPDDPRSIEQLTRRRLQAASWMDTVGLRTQAEQQRSELFAWYEKQAAGATRIKGPRHGLAVAYHDLARSLAALGHDREQQKALRGALKLEPDAPALLSDLAWSLALPPDAPPRESAEAIELARRAIAASPNDSADRGNHSPWHNCEQATCRSPQRRPGRQWNCNPTRATPRFNCSWRWSPGDSTTRRRRSIVTSGHSSGHRSNRTAGYRSAIGAPGGDRAPAWSVSGYRARTRRFDVITRLR